MRTVLIATALIAVPLLAPVPAVADTIYPWCLYDSRGGVNCGFVSERQCMRSKTANADMCGLNGLYFRHPVRYADRPIFYGNEPYGYPPKRYRYYRR